MPLTEEDYENLRAESDAEPERFRSWDPHQRFRTEYSNLHPEEYPDLHPEAQRELEVIEGEGIRDENEIEQLPTVSSSSSTSNKQYEGIRARPTAGRGRTSTYSYDTDLHRSETNRINGPRERNQTALDRINTHRSQHFGTVASTTSRKKKDLPNFGGGKSYPPALPAKEEYVVEFDGQDDPSHAQNWPFKKKWVDIPVEAQIATDHYYRLYISCIAIWSSLAATFGSSIFSPAAVGVEREFHVGTEVGTLGTSLFVLGYAFGPVVSISITSVILLETSSCY